MKILSLNCRNWNRDRGKSSPYYWKARRDAMVRLINDENPDVLCLQELLPPVSCKIPSTYKRVGIGVSHSIWVRRDIKVKRWSFHIHCDYALIEYKGEEHQIVNVHSHWNPKILRKTLLQIEHLTNSFVQAIACGDFNNGLAAIRNQNTLAMASARLLLGYDESEDTYTNFTKPESHGAIDHFFVRGANPMSYHMNTCGYGALRISDHYPIVLTIER